MFSPASWAPARRRIPPSSVPEILGREVSLGPAHPHGRNIRKKLLDASGGPRARQRVIETVAAAYLKWRKKAEAVPYGAHEPDEQAFVFKQAALYDDYRRRILDDPSVDVFDSRGALQSSALEELCFFLFGPLLTEVAHELAIGHYSVYQGLSFAAASFREFSAMPVPSYPVGNLDFVIGKKIESTLATDAESRTSSLYVPAVAIECKTYLDRPRFIESDNLAQSIKAGFSGCLYVVLSEFLKLNPQKVNIFGSQVDRIYVLRREKNVDRMIRRAQRKGLAPIHKPAVLDLFRAVRDHLGQESDPSETWRSTGILK